MSNTKTWTRHQLDAARTQLWHQDGTPLLTLDSATEWLNTAGFVPYLPLAGQLPAPVPSFVEAVLGRPQKGFIPGVAVEAPAEEVSLAIEVEEREPEEANEAAEELIAAGTESSESSELSESAASSETSEDAIADENSDESVEAISEPAKPAPIAVDGFSEEELETAHRMFARMVADGSAVPLRLLGGLGDQPDFVCSADVFSFVYTLRGDKGYKLPPVTSGSMKVSTLGLHVWEALKEKGPQTALSLVTETGKEVTGAAVARALSELWSIGRVIPVPQTDGSPAVWENTTSRYMRHIKAGSNAGVPTALSAMLSLYLAQVIAATTEEMEIILSPLVPRSRVREIVNGLSATRQLDESVVEGKTYYFVAGSLPEFEPEAPKPVVEQPAAAEEERSMSRRPYEAKPTERRSFSGGDRPAYGRKPAFGGDRPARPFTPREGGDRERRPFARSEGERSSSFERRPAAGGFDRPRRPYAPRTEGDRPSRPYTPREGGDRPSRPFTPRTFDRSGGSGRSEDRPKRPFSPRDGFDGPRRPFTPREGGDRPSRPFTPRSFDRSSDAPRRPYAPRGEGSARPYTPRSNFDGPKRPYTPREGGDRPSRPFTPRSFDGASDRPRRPYAPREGGDRPSRPFTPRSFDRSGDGPRRFDGPKRPFTPRGEGDRPSRPYAPREGGDRPSRPFTPRSFDRSGGGGRSEDRPRRPYTPREGGAPRSFDGPKRPYTPRGEGSDRPRAPRSFDRSSDGPKRPYTPRGDGDAPKRPYKPREGGAAPRSGGSFGSTPGGRFGAKFGPKKKGPGGPRKGSGK